MNEMEEKVLEKAFELGQKYEKKNTGCAQSVIAALFDALDIWNEDIFKSASGLADGLGLTGDGSCGALVGASMVIGFLFGRERKDFGDIQKPIKSYMLVKQLHDQYIQEYGSCRCHDVQKTFTGKTWNMWNPEDLKNAMEPGGLLDHCPQLVGNVARLACKIILDNGFTF
ncbi:MAG: C_GCAxxG_C_C family protein [Candidatus Lokiarchaeota archaeon]|nr:C_GCAxxG_C_C family protein [Candidatus Lokiarchaeota archaeon]